MVVQVGVGEVEAGHSPRRVKHRHIEHGQVENVWHAWLFSIQSGTPLNLFVSINFANAPSDLDPLARIGKLRDAMKAWMYRHAPGVPFCWFEAREKPRAKGEGVHLAVHVPPHLHAAFGRALPRWVAQHSAHITNDTCDVREVGYRWWERRDYMLKAATMETKQALGMKRFSSKSHQGVIEGPRVRVSHSLGPTARDAAGYVPHALAQAA